MTTTAQPQRLKLSDIIVLTLGSALFAALGNSIVVLLQIHVFGLAMSATPDFAYLSPIGYTLIFCLIALPSLVLSWVLPARMGNAVIPAIFATVSAFALLALIPRVHWIALLLIAIGVGIQVGRVFSRRLLSARRTALRTTAACAAGMAVIIASTMAVRARDAKALASARSAAPDDAPNVLLLILDTVRARNLSVYGYPKRTTPVLERLAAAGTVFEHAFSTGTFSAPTHSSMMTGLWGSQTGADFTYAIRSEPTTLAEALNARGYVSGAFVANAVWAGRNVGIGRGFVRYEDFPWTFRQAIWSTTLTQSRTGRTLASAILLKNPRHALRAIKRFDLRFESYSEDRLPTPVIIDRFWRWRDGVGKQQPFFAMVNLMDAHGPYLPPHHYRGMFGDSAQPINRYDGAIAYLDSIVGGFTEQLRQRGELERTVIIVTADHGELFGEHGVKGHVESLYHRATRVPLIVSGGAVPAGVRVRPEVSMRDLAATVLDIAGARQHDLPGRSLRVAWETGSNHDVSPVIIETPKGKNVDKKARTHLGAIVAAVDSSWYYIRYFDNSEELFDWRSDSLESRNMIATPAGREAANRLLEVITEELQGTRPTPLFRHAANGRSR